MASDIAIFATSPQHKSCDHRNGAALRNPQNARMDEIEWIRQGLKKPGKTQKGLADWLNLDPAQVSRLLKGDRTLKAVEIRKISEYLEETPPPGSLPPPSAHFARRAAAHDIPARDENTNRAYGQETSGHSDKIPVMGTAEGGDNGWSLWNGDVVEFVPRPPNLIGAPNAYAVYVTGTSMEPRYHPGEILFVHPGKPVQPGAYVLVQTKPRTEGDAPRAYVKRLLRRTADKFVLEQYNPPKKIDLFARDVITIHRVMGSGE
jgi:phage repressor protein C with HTH and peptisase S24 domain